MTRPSFQFYPADWRANAKLRRCTDAERGIWIDAMCLLHDSEEYGVLRWPLKDVAQALGCKVSALQSLRTKGVLKGADAGERCDAFIFTPRHAGKAGASVTLVDAQDGPIWFSSRMVRDEYLRTLRATHGQVKDAPKPPFGVPKGEHLSRDASARAGGRSSSSSSSASAENPESTVGLTPDRESATADPKTRELRQQATQILVFLNEKAGKNYQPVKTNIDLIVARLKEGGTVDDMRAVIAKKVREWTGRDGMDEYLRPATLFGAKNFWQKYQGELGAPDAGT